MYYYVEMSSHRIKAPRFFGSRDTLEVISNLLNDPVVGELPPTDYSFQTADADGEEEGLVRAYPQKQPDVPSLEEEFDVVEGLIKAYEERVGHKL